MAKKHTLRVETLGKITEPGFFEQTLRFYPSIHAIQTLDVGIITRASSYNRTHGKETPLSLASKRMRNAQVVSELEAMAILIELSFAVDRSRELEQIAMAHRLPFDNSHVLISTTPPTKEEVRNEISTMILLDTIEAFITFFNPSGGRVLWNYVGCIFLLIYPLLYFPPIMVLATLVTQALSAWIMSLYRWCCLLADIPTLIFFSR